MPHYVRFVVKQVFAEVGKLFSAVVHIREQRLESVYAVLRNGAVRGFAFAVNNPVFFRKSVFFEKSRVGRGLCFYGSFRADGVYHRAAVKVVKVFKFRQREKEPEHAFFRIRNGKVSVGRKAVFRELGFGF